MPAPVLCRALDGLEVLDVRYNRDLIASGLAGLTNRTGRPVQVLVVEDAATGAVGT